jgi:hypothetical protein
VNCSTCNRSLAHPGFTCPQWADHNNEGFDDWPTYERAKGDKFMAWATPIIRYTNGSRYRYAILQPEPHSGLRWAILRFTLPLPGNLPELDQESSGAFYDADDHPEGALAWATAWARKHAEKKFGCSF